MKKIILCLTFILSFEAQATIFVCVGNYSSDKSPTTFALDSENEYIKINDADALTTVKKESTDALSTILNHDTRLFSVFNINDKVRLRDIESGIVSGNDTFSLSGRNSDVLVVFSCILVK